MKKEWIKECERFQKWFTKLGGNVSSNESMQIAFSKIEPKKKQKSIYEIIGKA